jgi:hypothetical protein
MRPGGAATGAVGRRASDPYFVMTSLKFSGGASRRPFLSPSGGRPAGYPRPGQSWLLLAKAPAAEHLNVWSVKSFGSHAGKPSARAEAPCASSQSRSCVK